MGKLVQGFIFFVKCCVLCRDFQLSKLCFYEHFIKPVLLINLSFCCFPKILILHHVFGINMCPLIEGCLLKIMNVFFIHYYCSLKRIIFVAVISVHIPVLSFYFYFFEESLEMIVLPFSIFFLSLHFVLHFLCMSHRSLWLFNF